MAAMRIGSFPEEMARWHMAAAENHADVNDFVAAEQSLQDAASWDEDNPDIYLIRASWHAKKKEDARELEAIQAAIDIAPNRPNGYVARNDYYEKRKQIAKTLPDCDELVRLYEEEGVRDYFSYKYGTKSLQPFNRRAYHRALANEKIAEGLEDANKSIEIFGKSFAVLDTRGFLYYRQGDHEKAIRDLDLAVRGQAGRVKKIEKQYKADKSGLYRDQLLFDQRTLAILILHRMHVLEALGEDEKATSDRKQIVELGYDPDNKDLH